MPFREKFFSLHYNNCAHQVRFFNILLNPYDCAFELLNVITVQCSVCQSTMYSCFLTHSLLRTTSHLKNKLTILNYLVYTKATARSALVTTPYLMPIFKLFVGSRLITLQSVGSTSQYLIRYFLEQQLQETLSTKAITLIQRST